MGIGFHKFIWLRLSTWERHSLVFIETKKKLLNVIRYVPKIFWFIVERNSVSTFFFIFKQISVAAVYAAQWNIIFIINSSKQILFHAFNKFYPHFLWRKSEVRATQCLFIHSYILMDQNSMQKLKFHSIIFCCAVLYIWISFDISNSKMLCVQHGIITNNNNRALMCVYVCMYL